MSVLLFVCTGNTCRSPLAAAIAGAWVAKRGLTASVSVLSAGTAAVPGHPASVGSVAAAAERQLDLSAHRSQPLTLEHLRGATLILTMTSAHLQALHRYGESAEPVEPVGLVAGKAYVLTQFAAGSSSESARGSASQTAQGDSAIVDPYGHGPDAYARMAAQLDQFVDAAMRRAFSASPVPPP